MMYEMSIYLHFLLLLKVFLIGWSDCVERKTRYIKIHKIDIKNSKFIVFNKTFEDSIVFLISLSCLFGCFCGFYYFIECIIIFIGQLNFLFFNDTYLLEYLLFYFIEMTFYFWVQKNYTFLSPWKSFTW